MLVERCQTGPELALFLSGGLVGRYDDIKVAPRVSECGKKKLIGIFFFVIFFRLTKRV